MIKTAYGTLLILATLLLIQCKGQNTGVAEHYDQQLGSAEGARHYRRAMELSRSGNAHLLMSQRSYLGANNAIIMKDNDDDVIEFQMKLVENIINSARSSRRIANNQSSFKDDFMSWISKAENGQLNQEVPLYESYSFFYITQFLYYTRTNGWYDDSRQNQTRWNKVLSFVETNVWTKWYERSISVKGNPYWYFLRGRTHMGSHWAGVAMYLNVLTKSPAINSQTALVTEQYDILLRRNLKEKGRGYIWNSTYDNVEGTYASEVSENLIQDVSHGNHVISYIVAAYEFGSPNWSRQDLERLSYTLVDFVYDKENNLFRDNVDGSPSEIRPGWGNFVADGWIKLADYNSEVKAVFQRFSKTKMLRKYDQELQFRSTLNER